jgi:hypothetical protein
MEICCTPKAQVSRCWLTEIEIGIVMDTVASINFEHWSQGLDRHTRPRHRHSLCLSEMRALRLESFDWERASRSS